MRRTLSLKYESILVILTGLYLTILDLQVFLHSSMRGMVMVFEGFLLTSLAVFAAKRYFRSEPKLIGTRKFHAYELKKAKILYRQSSSLCNVCGRSLPTDKYQNSSMCSPSCDKVYTYPYYLTMALMLYLIAAISLSLPLVSLTFIFFSWMLIYVSIEGIETDSLRLRLSSYVELDRKNLIKQVTSANQNPYNQLQEDRSPISIPASGKMKYLPDIDLRLPLCCYLTARLGEKYCECGKTVPSQIIRYIDQ